MNTAKYARALGYKLLATAFGKVPFTDCFGLRYFLWKDSRVVSTVLRGCRTDDTGVIVHIFKILEGLQALSRSVVCFDVGAYLGVMGLAMASRSGREGKVYLFEPLDYNYRCIMENIRLNRDPRMEVVKAALSDVAGVEEEVIRGDEPSTSFLSCAKQGIRHGAVAHKVITETIDSFSAAHGIKEVDILKVDTEGMDERVLAGGCGLLGKGLISYIFFEFDEKSETSRNCVSLLTSYNYDVFFVVRNGDYVVRDLKNYPFASHRPCLNMLAISERAPLFKHGEGLLTKG